MFKPIKLILPVIAIIFLASCAGMVNVKVDSIKGKNVAEKGYTLLPAKEELRGLEFNEYARYIHKGLEARGYINVDDIKSSDLTIFVDFGISEPNTYTSTTSIPQWGQTGVTSSYTTGSINTYGGFGSYSGTTNYIPSYGITGYMPVTSKQTSYTRFLTLVAVDNNEWKKKDKSTEELWKTSVLSDGSSGSLRRVMPAMVAAAYPHFGKNTGQQITIEISEDDDKIKSIKGEITQKEVIEDKSDVVESLLSIF